MLRTLLPNSRCITRGAFGPVRLAISSRSRSDCAQRQSMPRFRPHRFTCRCRPAMVRSLSTGNHRCARAGKKTTTPRRPNAALTQIRSALTPGSATRRILGPAYFGAPWTEGRPLTPMTQWQPDLNLTPMFRAAAGLGAEAVRGEQETLSPLRPINSTSSVPGSVKGAASNWR